MRLFVFGIIFAELFLDIALKDVEQFLSRPILLLEHYNIPILALRDLHEALCGREDQ